MLIMHFYTVEEQINRVNYFTQFIFNTKVMIYLLNFGSELMYE